MGSIRLGKILDLEIALDYSWFIVFFLLVWSLSVGVFPGLYNFGPGASWLLGIAAALLLFASVLVHEISHALVARRHGTEVSRITLFLFGGVAQLRGEPESPRAEFLIAGIGPVVSFVIGVLCLGVSWVLGPFPLARPATALFSYLGFINIVLAIFNLVPGFPLDGGRLLRSAIWHVTGDFRKATRWASYGGRVVAWMLIGYGLIFRVLLARDLGGLWLAFIGWFLNNAAEASYQQLLLRRALSGVRVSEVMNPEIPAVDGNMTIDAFVENYLLPYDFRVYPVTREDEVVGIVTVEDVRGVERRFWTTVDVASLAHAPEAEQVVSRGEDAWDALTRMMERELQRLLVVENGLLVGIVSRDAIIRLVQRKMLLGIEGEGTPGRTREGARRLPSRYRGWNA